MLKDLYLDYASSTPIFPEVLKTYTDLLSNHYANSSALHDAGLKVSKMLEESRLACANLLNVKASTLTFTSGATQSNNIFIKGIAYHYQNRGKHIITSVIEHASVLECFKDLEKYDGFECTYLAVDYQGRINPDDLLKALREDTILVSIMTVNNETGGHLDTQNYAQLVHQHSKAFFHTDAVQALAKVEFDLSHYDAASFSAHKINGLKGSGLLYIREGISLRHLLSGGHYENGQVPGTVNALSHIVFAKTLRLALNDYRLKHQQVQKVHDYLRMSLNQLDNIVINSPQTHCSAYILNFSILDLPSQVMLNFLSKHHIYASAAATCSDKSFKASHVLSAMGKSDIELKTVIRISLSNMNTLEDIDRLIQTLKEGIHKYARTH